MSDTTAGVSPNVSEIDGKKSPMVSHAEERPPQTRPLPVDHHHSGPGSSSTSLSSSASSSSASNFKLSSIITPAVRDFVAGSAGGVAGVIVSQPLDTIKVRLQTQDVLNKKYKNSIDCFLKIVKHEGPFGLFKGMLSPIVGVATINAVLFSAYGQVLRFLTDPKDGGPSTTPTVAQCMIAGTVAGFLNTAVSSPVELTKIRLQSKKRVFRGPWHCLSYTYQVAGLRGVYRGLGATIWRDAPSYAVYFAFYEWMSRQFLKDGQQLQDLAADKSLLAGGISGILCWVSTYGFDVVKTRIQAQGPTPPPEIQMPPNQGTPVDPKQSSQYHRHHHLHGTSSSLFHPVATVTIPADVMKKEKSWFGKTVHHPAQASALSSLYTPIASPSSGMARYFPNLSSPSALTTPSPSSSSVSVSALTSVAAASSQQVPKEYIYKGTWDCAYRIYKAEGISVFFRGFNATILRAFPTNAATFWVVAVTTRTMNKFLDE